MARRTRLSSAGRKRGRLVVWLRPELVPVREFQSADGSKVAVIFRRPDGHFGFAGEHREEIGGDLVWTPVGGSGIYQTFEAAQCAALVEMPWLVGENSD